MDGLLARAIAIILLGALAAACLGAAACGGDAETPGVTVVPDDTPEVVEATVVPDSTPEVVEATVVPDDTPEVVEATVEPEGDTEVMEVTVGPELKECQGVAPQMCMVVDGGLFYQSIEGFEHEAGYEYRLRIERYDPWNGNPPADASMYAYRLIEVLEKVRAGN